MCYLVLVSLSILFATWSAAAAPAVESHLSASDLTRLQKVFGDSYSSNDLQSIYYASLNLELTNTKEKEALCKQILALHKDSKLNAFEKDYYLIGSHKNLRCSEKLPESLLSSIYAAVKKNLTTVTEIYYRVATQKLLGVQIDAATTTKLAKSLEELLRKDDSLLGLGYAFNLAPELGAPAAFVTSRIEDVFVQADEVDGKILQFEGGLSITALLVNGAFHVTKAFSKPLPINEEQAKKFANYFLSRRSVQTAKGAHLLLEALKTLNGAGKISPVCIQIIGKGQLQAKSPLLSITIVDLLGKALLTAPQAVTAKVVNTENKSVLVEKVQFVSKSSDKTVFTADLTVFKPARGVYSVEINAAGGYQQQLNFKILGRVVVKSLELGVAEADAGGSGGGYHKHTLTYPNKLAEILNADNTQKLLMKTVLADQDTSKAISVHQAFVQLYNKANDLEIVFIAEQDSSKSYKFDLDIGAHAEEFKHTSGQYEIYLLVGDQLLSNSFKWHLANVNLKFPASETKETKKPITGVPLPEIAHQFRVPEKRPSRIVSDIFTGLCVTPLVLFIISWSKLGLNVSNFDYSLSTIGFHLGFGGILTLFGVFWWQLNMFQTLRLLIPIALLTFLCGNRLLRRIYARRVAKTTT